MSEEFNPEKMTQIVSILSKIPRLVGTDGEKKAVEYCKSLFKEINIELKEEEFTCVRGWVGWIQQLLFGFCAFLIVLMSVFIFINPILNLIIVGLVVLIFILIYPRLTGSKGKGLPQIGKKFVSKNLYAVIPPKNSQNVDLKNETQFIIISGHYDTKSQTFTTFFRALAYFLLVVGLIPLLIIMLTAIIMKFIPPYQISILIKSLTIIFSLISLAGSIMLTFNKLGNDSPGTLDNASSIAVIYEIARIIKNNSGLENTSVVLTILSAEELGMWGSRAFCNAHKNDISPNKSSNINIDMIGLKNAPVSIMKYYGLPFKKPISPKLNELIFKIANRLKIPIKGFWMPIGASTDGFIFRSYGYEGCEFIVYEAAKKAHHKSDNMELWDPNVAVQNCKLIYELIQTISVYFI